MSKNKQTQDEFEAELKGELPVYDRLAITILPKAGGGYNLAKILVDTKNLKAGALEIVDTADSRSEAAEKFKLLVVKNGIL